jgi:hypothetical protein
MNRLRGWVGILVLGLLLAGRGWADPTASALPAITLEQLTRAEAALRDEFHALARDHATSDAVRQSLRDPAVDEPAVRAKIAAQAAFQDHLDDYTKIKTIYLMQSGLDDLLAVSSATPAQAAALRAELAGILSPKKRLKPTQYNNLVREYFERLKTTLRPAPARPGRVEAAPRLGWSAQLAQWQKALAKYFPLSGPALGATAALLTSPGAEARLKKAGVMPERQTPLTGALDAALKQAASLHDIQYEVSGHTELPTQTPPADTVRLYAIVHRDPYADPALVAHLNIPDYYLFAAIDRFLPQTSVASFVKQKFKLPDGHFVERLLPRASLASLAKRRPEILPVDGPATESVQKLVDNLKRSPTRNVVMFAEGQTSLLGETRSPHLTFSKYLVQRLIKEGYKVEIVPVTSSYAVDMLDRAGTRFTNLLKSAQRHRVDIQAPWPPALVQRLAQAPAVADQPPLHLMLRSAWLEAYAPDAIHHDENFFGQLPAARLEAQFRREFQPAPASCGSATEALALPLPPG